MRLTVSESVLTAVCYADVFDYPLTEDEVVQWCVGRTLSASQVKRTLEAVTNGGASNQNAPQVFFLKGRRAILRKRRIRSLASQRKFLYARKKSQLYRLIPSVLLVGVTGGVAAGNADPEDDIDLFFIVSDGTLWVSRFLITVVTELFARRRRPNTAVLTDSLCLNMFLTDSSLRLPEVDCDLYSAHEILSMSPLWEYEGVYRKFLSRNLWVTSFFPSAWNERMNELDAEVQGWKTYPRTHKSVIWIPAGAVIFAFRRMEWLFAYFQKLYMKPRVTREVITPFVLRFHPQDIRTWLRVELAKRLTKLNIPLDKVFYGRLK